MKHQDAVKARIKKLEGDIVGLLHKLNHLRTAPTFSNDYSATQAFNAITTHKDARTAFHSAGRVQDILQRQIIEIRNELASLMTLSAPMPEFELAA